MYDKYIIIKCIVEYEKCKNYKMISDKFKIARSTIRKWFILYKNNTLNFSYERKNSYTKITNTCIKIIDDIFKDYNIYKYEAKVIIKDKYNLSLSLPTISKICNILKIVKTKIKYTTSARCAVLLRKTYIF